MDAPELVVTEQQRRAERALRAAAARTVAECRQVAALRRRGQMVTERLDRLERQHPEFKSADIREVLRYRKLLLALVAAFALDAVMAAPVAEHLLRTFLLLPTQTAQALRFALPMTLLIAELGIAQLRTWPDHGKSAWWITNALAVVLVLVMPLLVGETELVGRGGVFGGQLDGLAAGMMLLTLAIHGFVLFSGAAQHDAVSYMLYRLHAAPLAFSKRSCSESSRRHANAAGDQFAEWVAERDRFIERYPTARAHQPYWGVETIEVLNQVYGYEVIAPPRPAPSRQAATTGEPGGAAQAHERRMKESDAEVVAD